MSSVRTPRTPTRPYGSGAVVAARRPHRELVPGFCCSYLVKSDPVPGMEACHTQGTPSEHVCVCVFQARYAETTISLHGRIVRDPPWRAVRHALIAADRTTGIV